MKLVSFDRDGRWCAGLVSGSYVYDLGALLAFAFDAGPISSVRDVLDRYGDSLRQISKHLETIIGHNPRFSVGSVESLRLGPPVTNPRKVLCVGLNYRDHVAEGGRQLPKNPDIFAKFATSLIGGFDEIDCGAVTQNLDFEGELAIVIGKPGRFIEREAALSHVAGVMVLNDITARDLQYNGTQWIPGKAVDGSTPCGPALLSLDEVGNPQSLNIETRVNGKVMQSSNTKHMIFDLPEIISYVSRFVQLLPGDIIATGTPEGVGAKRNPPVWLQAGDVVEVEVEKVGTLRNVVR